MSRHEMYSSRLPFGTDDDEYSMFMGASRQQQLETDRTAWILLKVFLFVIVILVLLWLLWWLFGGRRGASGRGVWVVDGAKKPTPHYVVVLESVDDAFFKANEEAPQVWERACACCKENNDSSSKGCTFTYRVLADNREDKTLPVDVADLTKYLLTYDCCKKKWSTCKISDCDGTACLFVPEPPTD